MVTKKYLFLFLLFLTITAFCQPELIPIKQKGVYFNTVLVPLNKNIQINFVYKIAYNRLVFIKENENFTSHFTITIEALDSASHSIKREIIERSLISHSFEETTKDDLFCEGVQSFIVSQGKYIISPFFKDCNSSDDQTFPKFKLRTDSVSNSIILSPIVGKLGLDSVFYDSGFGNSIPFSHQSYELAFICKDTSIRNFNVKIRNFDSSLNFPNIKPRYTSNFIIATEGGKLKIKKDKAGILGNFFIIPEINKNLFEGTAIIKLTSVQSPKDSINIIKNVIWPDKPKTLSTPVLAARLLKYLNNNKEPLDGIEKDSLLKAILNFWEKSDPTIGTSFNELMQEFYVRADYALKNFSTLSLQSGAESDRGRIYILYGKPDTIERDYHDKFKVQETWHYSNPAKLFIFKDISGLGNFILYGVQ
jgi:GWxTD domain-containing protein